MVQDSTEIPAGDNEAGEPTKTEVRESPLESNAAAKSEANQKGLKTSTGKRVLIGILLAVVAIVAIAGITVTLVLENRSPEPSDENYSNNNNYEDEYHFRNDDEIIDKVGEPIEKGPFEVDASMFSFDATEPYTSIEDLRKDIEALATAFANAAILDSANMYQNNDYYYARDHPVPEVAMSMDMDFADESMPVAAPTSGASASKEASSSSKAFEGVDDFETYQHEAGVVKEDLVKSNGEYVFAAVDDRIKVWDLDGNVLETTAFPSSGNYNIYIDALLMNPAGNKLTVIASEWGNYQQYSLVDHARQTQVTVFAIEGSSLSQISRTYIDGYHSNAYSVGDNVHIVTRDSLRIWSYIDDPLSRYMFDEFDGVLTNEEYVAKATEKAEEIIPRFVDDVIDLVTEGDEIVLSRLVAFPESIKDYKSITQITSFDTSNVVGKGDLELHTSKSLVLQPGNTAYVYATDEWIWVADESWSWGFEDQGSLQETMLLGFRLDGASSKFAAVGTVPGQLLNQFSIDFTKDDGKEYVRIAVTQNFFQNDWWIPRPMPMMENTAEDERQDEPQDESESRTLNEIIIFEIPEVGDDSHSVKELNRLGSVELGKKDETITAVRFFPNYSYVVTFERTDPFYVLDLSDPMDPKILGELEIPGFSQFMHPMDEDNSMLLTVGQDADEFGFVTGFQISIFDSTIPTDPKLVDRLVISNDGGSTGSESSWDERAFRYIQVGEVGRLIIPLYSYKWEARSETFNGFTVFGVDLNKTEGMITREIDINHEQDSEEWYNSKGCYCSQVYLPVRSFVFDGNLMTLKESTVISTDLVSKETEWSVTLQDYENCWC